MASMADARPSRHVAIRSDLIAQMAAGRYPVGSFMPSERELAEQYGVALGTIRRATGDLEAMGLLDRRQGSGTLVQRPFLETPLLRFFRHDRGDEPVQSTVHSLQVEATAPDGAPWGAATPCLHLRRTRTLGRDRRLAEDIWLPMPRFEALAQMRPEQFPPLLYPVFESACGVLVVAADEAIHIEPAGQRDQSVLDVTPGGLVAVIERTAVDAEGQTVEFRSTRCAAAHFRYHVTIG